MPLCAMIQCPDRTFGTASDQSGTGGTLSPPMLRAAAVLVEVRLLVQPRVGLALVLLLWCSECHRLGWQRLAGPEESHTDLKAIIKFICAFNCGCLPERWVRLVSIVILWTATMIAAARASDN